MIVVDTSALIAVLKAEPGGAACKAVLDAEDHLLISAGTLAEALIVSGRRDCGPQMAALIESLALEIIPVTPATSFRIGRAYEAWGKGVHPAGLNFGDCFAYDLAKEHGCALLFVGNDFAQTDVNRAMKPRW